MKRIKISQKSKDYLKVFEDYKLDHIQDWNPKFSGRVIFHLYPVEDTMNDENDNLQGFIDALLFDVHVYDCKNMKKYEIKNRDQIEINVLPHNTKIRIFKDFSTMIIVDRGCQLKIFQSLEVNSL